ncbi:hypothetical protein BH09BAC5_BH09BAC5_26450 [soil metagenome]
MKCISFILFTLLFSFSLAAQIPQLWGMTNFGGGNNSHGAIIKINGNGTGYATEYSFTGLNGAGLYPRGSLLYSDSLLYGMTYSGGQYGIGMIFGFDPITGNETTLFNFNDTLGENPQGNLILADDGKLYGMSTSGGDYDQGVIFSFDIASNTYSDEYNFDTLNGEFPLGSLVQANDGKLYGMTVQGGIYDDGIIFSFDPVNNVFLKLFEFNITLGKYPVGSLCQATNGKLYGMTSHGGSNDLGVLFSFDPVTNIFTKYHDFIHSTGKFPLGSLIQASNGKLYGTTEYGGTTDDGVIFSFNPFDSTYADIHNCNIYTGTNPIGSLVQASDGELYGMTYVGGANNDGTVFQFNTSGNIYTKIFDFTSNTGLAPWGDLVELNPAVNGIENLIETNLFTLSPNPSNGEFILNGNFKEKSVIEIFDMWGQKVFEKEIPNGEQTLQINLNLNEAIYSYRITNSETVLKSGEFIISK